MSIYVVGAVFYLLRSVVPLTLRRINPLYAAHTIERARPSLKNSLVNFLLFRADPTGLPPVVFDAIEEQAATNLAKVEVDATVDRSKLVRLAYALLAVVLVCVIYTLFSPKGLWTTVGRVAMPWAEIDPPMRTVIGEIDPGNAQAFRGQQVTVERRIDGLPSDGRVTLLYTTADRQIVDRPVEMTVPADSSKYRAVLPSGDSSLQQTLFYRIEAGDATTRQFRVEVVAAPTIVVRSVTYKYPEYTGLLTQRVERQGDIKAIEGTQITLDALANQDIQSAHVDFDCDGKFEQRMQADGRQAQATFHLGSRKIARRPSVVRIS